MRKNNVKPAPFVYYDPRSVEQAVSLLGRIENARLPACGQSLLPTTNFHMVTPNHLIDLNRINALAHICLSLHRLSIDRVAAALKAARTLQAQRGTA